MGIRERIVKALNLPNGAITQTEAEILSQQTIQSGTRAEPLERNALDYVVPFAPGRPLIPSLINPPREDGRADPRRYEFPVAWNLQITEQRVVPFRLLRDVADGSDLVRKCIEVVKAGIAGLDWDISLSPEATERIISEAGPEVSHSAAAKAAREKLMPDIVRCKDFWQMPDRVNGLNFSEWVAMAIEEMLVIDALSIYPNKTMNDENLHSLEILDGATIKPLLDDRGGRPVPPFPAYQQILWGFPRGEFTASADADGEFSADDLVYAPRTRRPFTPYGYSAVERALPVIDLYMKRLQWLRTEFTDGVTPDMLIKTDATYGGNPEILRAYERVFNDEMSGKTEARRRARIFPQGMDPIITPGLDVKYKPDFDEYLVRQICSHFGVLPTQIGFAPKGGLGGSGVQEGEAVSAEVIGQRPIIMWMTDLLNQMSYRFLGMPKDLVFTLSSGEQDDETMDAQRREVQLRSGQITLNEIRAESGRPLYTFPEADVPLLASGIAPAVIPSAEQSPVNVDIEEEGESGEGNLTDAKSVAVIDVSAKSVELDAFKRWSRGKREREFVFEFVGAEQGKALNDLAKRDASAARRLATALKGASVEVGAFVSWGASGGTARGKVERIVREGKLNVPGSSFEINASEDDPAVLIRVYREGAEGWKPTDTRVGHRASTLRRIEALKAADDSFTPPEGVQSAAKRALEWIKEGHAGSGFTDVGRKRAADLARGAAVSAETIGRMRNFFSRHEGDKTAEGFNAGEKGFPSPGRVAWDAWGGDAGKRWADSVYERLNPDKAVGRGRSSAPGLAGGKTGPTVNHDVPGEVTTFAWSR